MTRDYSEQCLEISKEGQRAYEAMTNKKFDEAHKMFREIEHAAARGAEVARRMYEENYQSAIDFTTGG